MKELQEFFRKQILSVVTYLQTTYILTCILRTVWTIESVPRMISAWCPAKSVTWYTTTLRCTNISQLVAHLFYPELSLALLCGAVPSNWNQHWNIFYGSNGMPKCLWTYVSLLYMNNLFHFKWFLAIIESFLFN